MESTNPKVEMALYNLSLCRYSGLGAGAQLGALAWRNLFLPCGRVLSCSSLV